MDADWDGLPVGPPFATAILKVADQFLRLRIDRDRGLSLLMAFREQAREVPKLGVAIGMRAPFLRFLVGLQTVPGALEQGGDRSRTHGMAVLGQFVGQLRCALAGPAQRRLRIAARRRLDQRQQRAEHGRIARRQRPPARAGTTDPLGGPHPLPPGRPQVAQAGMNRRPRQSCRACDHAHAAIPDLACLCRGPLPSSPLIQFRRHDPVFAPKARDRWRFSHALVMTESPRSYKNYLYELFLREP